MKQRNKRVSDEGQTEGHTDLKTQREMLEREMLCEKVMLLRKSSAYTKTPGSPCKECHCLQNDPRRFPPMHNAWAEQPLIMC